MFLLLTSPAPFGDAPLGPLSVNVYRTRCCNVVVTGACHASVMSVILTGCASVHVKHAGLLPPIKRPAPTIKPTRVCESETVCVSSQLHAIMCGIRMALPIMRSRH